MDQDGEFIASFEIIRKNMMNEKNKTEILLGGETLEYKVLVVGEFALRIRQCGFQGMHLWISGDLKNSGEIIAEELGFVDFPASGKTDEVLITEFSRNVSGRLYENTVH